MIAELRDYGRDLSVPYHPNGKRSHFLNARMRLICTDGDEESISNEDAKDLLRVLIRRVLRRIDEEPTDEAVQYHINEILERMELKIERLELHLPKGE